MSRVYGYVRVSTEKQCISPDAQRQAIEDFARRRGVTINAWFQDAPVVQDGRVCEAASGGTPMMERLAGGTMCNRLQEGDLVIVAKLDRAFRSFLDGVTCLEEWWHKGVEFHVCDLGVDMGTMMGRMLMRILLAFAQLEREMNSQRVKEALAVRKLKNYAVSKYPGYGFKWERHWDVTTRKYVKLRVHDAEERDIMRQLAGWHLEGKSSEEMYFHLARHHVKTREGKEWSEPRIRRAIAAEFRLQLAEGRFPKQERFPTQEKKGKQESV